MNRIPGIALIVLVIALLIRYIPRLFRGGDRFLRRLIFPGYILVILYLTIFSRFLSARKIYNIIFNMNGIPTDEVVVGNRGSEWLAGSQGVSGIRLIIVGLSDPNSKLYIIPSCLMNLLLFLPFGMLFRCVIPRESAERDRRWILLCGLAVFLIECIQYISGLGQFDVLDILFNTAGFALGLKIYDRFLIYEVPDE